MYGVFFLCIISVCTKYVNNTVACNEWNSVAVSGDARLQELDNCILLKDFQLTEAMVTFLTKDQ